MPSLGGGPDDRADRTSSPRRDGLGESVVVGRNLEKSPKAMNSPDAAATLLKELKWLRRDEGRTLVRLQACPAIRQALGNPPERQLVDRFDDAVAQLGNDLRSLAVKNALGIGLNDSKTLTWRRETFGAQAVVSRGPDTVTNWENEKLRELAARLAAGSTRDADHWLVAVAVEGGRIVVVGEGQAESGTPMRQLFNPNPEPFFPGFIYVLPRYVTPERLTMSVFFMDAVPECVFSEASGDLLAFICGDGRQRMRITPGGIAGLEDAAAHVDVSWVGPVSGVYYGVIWQS